VNACPLHVVVIDDRRRFALHVWRYLSRSVGFGIGDVTSYRTGERRDSRREMADAEWWALATPAGDAVVWWVNLWDKKLPAKDRPWFERLQAELESAKEDKRFLFLIDVQGGAAEEFWPTALKSLGQLGVDPTPEVAWLVSSYGVGTRRFGLSSVREPLLFNIHPKSAETLQILAKRLWRPPCAPTARSHSVHILVTGAGFELKSREADRDPREATEAEVESIPAPAELAWISPLGIPPTAELLRRAYLQPIWENRGGDGKEQQGRELDFPLPNLRPESRKEVFEAAFEGRLDDLWNGLLKVLLKEPPRIGEIWPEGSREARMLEAEEEAREGFRSAFLGDDWGQLTQVLTAADLPWDVWLTTNYTQFVDRAISLLDREPLSKDKNHHLPWRILSIATEAEQLIRRLFFESQPGDELSERRLIFKLHGDLSHLSTMAIAGHDKELFSPLMQRVESLHLMYEASVKWIERLCRQLPDATVYWHIVGHGLKDKTLAQALRKIVLAVPGIEHRFLLVQPDAQKIKESLDPGLKELRWQEETCRADEWLAMLGKFFRRYGRMWDPETDGKRSFS
jgi:hypothetical protein